MVLCRESTLVKRSHAGDVMHVEPLKCRSWGCSYCRPMRSRQLRGLAMRGRPDTFLTLTVNPSHGDGPDDRARQLRASWVYLRRAARKRYGYKKLAFLAVFERTKKGEPHLHILMRVKWLDQNWISEVMAARMNAPVVDIRRVKGRKAAAAYVSKYVGKDPSTFKGCKRYWRSQDWAPDEYQPVKGAWHVEIVRDHYSHVVAQLPGQGWAPWGDRQDGLQVLWIRLQSSPRPPPRSFCDVMRSVMFVQERAAL